LNFFFLFATVLQLLADFSLLFCYCHSASVLFHSTFVSLLPPSFSISCFSSTDSPFTPLSPYHITLSNPFQPVIFFVFHTFSNCVLNQLPPIFSFSSLLYTTTPLIVQAATLSWEDPSSQLETLPQEQVTSEMLPLVGQIISQKTQNNQTVNVALTKAWSFANPFSFAILGQNTFLFKFSENEHISKILSQVWNVNGCLLALQTWSPKATLGELSLNIVPFWIQVHELPLHNMSLKNSIAIRKGLGNPVKIDSATGVDSIFHSFLRLLVEIDVSKPFNLGFSLHQDG
jgi:hypothetical protein